MLQRLGSQIFLGVGFILLCGMGQAAQAATQSNPWITQMILQQSQTPKCNQGNPYCGAHVPAPAAVPKPNFNPDIAPCNSAQDECAQEYSQEMTQNYQQTMQNSVSPPYNPCILKDNCSSVVPWWNATVVQPIEQKTIPYNPGVRSWGKKQNCPPINIGGVYVQPQNCQQ